MESKERVLWCIIGVFILLTLSLGVFIVRNEYDIRMGKEYNKGVLDASTKVAAELQTYSINCQQIPLQIQYNNQSYTVHWTTVECIQYLESQKK